MIEIWKDIAGYESYQVSTFGNVRRNARRVRSSIGRDGFKVMPARQVAINDNGRGYKILCTQVDRKKKNLYIHRLVALHFIPNPHGYLEVNHIDADKSNNHVNNLEWASPEMNKIHAVENGLVTHGEKNANAKLTKIQVVEILKIHNLNQDVSRIDLSKKYGVNDSVISRIINGKRWRRVHEEFHQNYVQSLK